MKRIYVYSSQFIRCPENPTQRIYLVLPEERPKGNIHCDGYMDIESDAQIEHMRYDGMTQFYLFTDEFMKSIIKPSH